MENMFNKTLLALAVAGASLSANAGILAVDAQNQLSESQVAAYDAAIAANANAVCQAYVTALDVTPTSKTGVKVPAAGTVTTQTGITTSGTAPVVHASATTNYDSTATSVVYDATTPGTAAAPVEADSCVVTYGTRLVTADDSKYSLEGATAKGLTITATQILGVGGLSAEDTVEITVIGGTVNEDASVNAKLNGGTDITLLGVVGNTIRFAVDTGVTAGTFGPRDIIKLTGLVVVPDSGADAVSLSSKVVNTAGVVYDSSNSTEITKIAKQYTAKTHVAADGIIDVATERFDFEANTSDSSVKALLNIDGVSADSLVVQVSEDTLLGNLTPKSGELVIAGNFSWMMDLDADEDGELSATEIESGFDYSAFTAVDNTTNVGELITAGSNALDAGESSLNTDMTELTIPVVVGVDADLNKYQVVTFKPAGKADATVSLETTKFIASLDFINDKTADSTTADVDLNVTTDLSVGEWTLNGSVVEVPYIPFGPNTQPIIRHTNTGAQTGDISVRYMVEELGGVYVQDNTWQSLGVIVEDAKPGVRNLLTPISDALKAKLGGDKFKVALEITTNVPGDDVTVYAAAKVTAEGQDRLTIGAFKGQ